MALMRWKSLSERVWGNSAPFSSRAERKDCCEWERWVGGGNDGLHARITPGSLLLLPSPIPGHVHARPHARTSLPPTHPPTHSTLPYLWGGVVIGQVDDELRQGLVRQAQVRVQLRAHLGDEGELVELVQGAHGCLGLLGCVVWGVVVVGGWVGGSEEEEYHSFDDDGCSLRGACGHEARPPLLPVLTAAAAAAPSRGGGGCEWWVVWIKPASHTHEALGHEGHTSGWLSSFPTVHGEGVAKARKKLDGPCA